MVELGVVWVGENPNPGVEVEVEPENVKPVAAFGVESIPNDGDGEVELCEKVGVPPKTKSLEDEVVSVVWPGIEKEKALAWVVGRGFSCSMLVSSCPKSNDIFFVSTEVCPKLNAGCGVTSGVFSCAGFGNEKAGNVVVAGCFTSIPKFGVAGNVLVAGCFASVPKFGIAANEKGLGEVSSAVETELLVLDDVVEGAEVSSRFEKSAKVNGLGWLSSTFFFVASPFSIA